MIATVIDKKPLMCQALCKHHYLNYFIQSYKQPFDIETIIKPFLDMRKWNLKEVK